ncbi:hypothetical protein V6N13_052103 [Hibiscus sabdariffa]
MNEDCGLINLYAPNEANVRKAIFEKLEEIIHSKDILWIVGGDFNTVKVREEKVGLSYDQASMNALSDFIENSSVVDLPIMGSKFTWSSLRETPTCCRLDRLLISPEIFSMLSDLSLQTLPKSLSDHNPLILCCVEFKSGPRPFKIFNH